MRLCAMAHIARDVEADRVANVAFNYILLSGTNHLAVNGGGVWFRPEVARVSRVTAVLLRDEVVLLAAANVVGMEHAAHCRHKQPSEIPSTGWCS